MRSVPGIVAEFRKQTITSSGPVGYILSQRSAPAPRARLDSLADSLTMIVVQYDRSKAVSHNVALSAIGGLEISALSNATVPYAGAFDRLSRIHREIEDFPLRAGALRAISRLSARDRSLGYLREVAASGDRTAYTAVGLLGRDTGDEGRAVLRDLLQRGSVIEPMARRELESLARYYGWIR
jgi:hypothetical protein